MNNHKVVVHAPTHNHLQTYNPLTQAQMGFFKKIFGSKSVDESQESTNSKGKDFNILKYDGVRALRSGQAAYAIKCLEHALAISDDLECHDYLSQAYIHTGDMAKAMLETQKMSEAQPDNIGIFIRMGDIAYMMEDYDAMKQAADKALEIDGDNVVALYCAARACNGQGDADDAIAMLTKAITLKDEFADARLLRGNILFKQGNHTEATDDAAYLETHHPDSEDVLLLVARTSEAAGNHEKAIADYGRVIDVNPFCVAAFKERGTIRRALGDEEGANEDMSTAMELDPETAASTGGDLAAEGIENKVKSAYKSLDPLGIFGN